MFVTDDLSSCYNGNTSYLKNIYGPNNIKSKMFNTWEYLKKIHLYADQKKNNTKFRPEASEQNNVSPACNTYLCPNQQGQ